MISTPYLLQKWFRKRKSVSHSSIPLLHKYAFQGSCPTISRTVLLVAWTALVGGQSVSIDEEMIMLHLLSVSMNPGEIQLTLAKSTHSTARLLARCRAAALEALYAACLCGMFTRIALTDAVIIRFPLPCSLK